MLLLIKKYVAPPYALNIILYYRIIHLKSTTVSPQILSEPQKTFLILNIISLDYPNKNVYYNVLFET